MVKTYCTANSLRMVGKAWQIRALLKQHATSHATLQQFLAVQAGGDTRRA